MPNVSLPTNYLPVKKAIIAGRIAAKMISAERMAEEYQLLQNAAPNDNWDEYLLYMDRKDAAQAVVDECRNRLRSMLPEVAA